MAKLTRSEKTKLVYDWFLNQRMSTMASLFVHTVPIKVMDDIIKENNLKK